MNDLKYPFVNAKYKTPAMERRRKQILKPSLLMTSVGWAIPQSLMPTASRVYEKIKAIVRRQSALTKELREIKTTIYEIQYRLNHDAFMRHQDMMGILTSMVPMNLNPNLTVETDFPVAYDSSDHLYPDGTINDNTRHPRFCLACENFFQRKLSYLDIGCSGGGMVLDFLLKGHLGIGIEGSDISLKGNRAEWRLLPDCLFTADVTKPFKVLENDSAQTKRFDVISAWEMLEHIHEEDLEQLFKNVSGHLAEGGIFVGSIGTNTAFDKTGHHLHMSVQEPEWWMEKMHLYGFEPMENQPFEFEDFARGIGAGPRDPNFSLSPNGFHFVVQASSGSAVN